MDNFLADALLELKPDSGKRILGGMHGLKFYLQSQNRVPSVLIKPRQKANAQWVYELKLPSSTLKTPEGTRAKRLLIRLPEAADNNLTYMLNDALMGGQDYPILAAILGVGVGFVSEGAGLFFSAATSAFSGSIKSHRVLARGGDEIWQVEEIGKEKQGNVFVPTHVNSYFLVDPNRQRSGGRQAWLIHEERKRINAN